MKILIDDFVQYSNAPEFLKSPALADVGAAVSLEIDFGTPRTFDCVGVGNTSATFITIDGEGVNLDPVAKNRNGLYLLTQPHTAQIITIDVPSPSLIGRIAIGKYRELGLGRSREPGRYSTNTPNLTVSGQVVAGHGGISGRRIDVDVRYKIDRDIFADFDTSHDTQGARGYPFFLLWSEKELNRFPYTRLYGRTDTEYLMQSSVNFFKYSKRFSFREAF